MQYTDGRTGLYVPQGGDLEFAVEWRDNLGAQVPIISAAADIRCDSSDEKVLDLGAHITISGGKANVLVPRAITRLLTDWGEGYWTLVATSATSSKILLEGPASLRRGAGRD